MAGIGGCGDRGGQGGVLVSPCPLCSTAEVANVIEACIVADSGAPLTMSVSADVTVTSITDVAGGNCQRVDRSSTGDMTKRLVLQPASGPSWTVFLRVPNLPATLISANDTLELSVTASTGGFLTPGEAEQTIALARDGQLIAFGVAGGSNLPILDSFGIEVSDAGAVCRVERCANVAHGTRIAVGSAQATIDQGRTAEVGNLSFTVEEHSRWYSNGGCDGYDRTRMGGYLTP
jgi:hypothetical protein